MAIPIILARALIVTAEQYIRRAGGWQFAVPIDIARKLYDQARPDRRRSRSEYYNIARSAIAASRAAANVGPNLGVSRLPLPPLPGILPENEEVAYYVIVVGNDQTGNEIFSTAVWIRADWQASYEEIQDAAIAAIGEGRSPGARQANLQQIVAYEVYVQLAGHKPAGV